MFQLAMLEVFVVVLILQKQYMCEQIKLYQTDGRVTASSDAQFKSSLLECSVLYENDMNSLSFNYNKETKVCELSDNFPEGSTISATGWNVYAHIVDGGWSSWLSWGSCSMTCKNGTRTRSRSCSNPKPSNGGQTCKGPSSEDGACNERDSCFLASNYFLGSNKVTQPEAVAVCERMSARLVIMESQEEIDFLETLVSEFSHWIGMTCHSITNCTWFDGSNVNSGSFTAWAPNEPKGLSCVWIGYHGNKWDDAYCDSKFKALCENT